MRTSTVIYYCVVGGAILNAVYTFYYQRDLELFANDEGLGWYTKLNFLGDFLISIAAILSHYRYKHYFPGFVRITYWLLLFWVVMAHWGNYENIIKNPATFYGGKGIGTFLNFGILFAVAGFRHIAKIQKLFLWIAIVFTVLGVANVVAAGIGFNRNDMLYVVREYANYLVYVFPFFFLQPQEKKLYSFLYYIFYAAVFFVILATASRSNILIFVLILLAKLYYQFRGSIKDSIHLLLGLAILVVFGAHYVLQSSFYDSFNTIIQIIEERSKEDTRSQQFEEFFRQYDIRNWLLGVGPTGTYYSSNVGGPYGSFDNQFILLGWWAGLPALLFYIYLLSRSLFRKYSKQRSWPDKGQVIGAKWTIFLWILAASGLAIWAAISCNLYYYFISISIGIATFRNKRRVVEAEQ